MSRARDCLIASLLLTAGVFAQDPSADVLRTIDGRSWRGTLTGITAAGVQFETPAGEERVALDEVQHVQLQRRPGVERLRASRPRVWLRSGQSLPAAYAGVKGAGGEFAWPYAGERLELPWRYLQAVQIDVDATTDVAFGKAVAAPPRDVDWLYAYQGEGEVRRYTMQFLRIEGDSMVVRFSGKEQSVQLDRVHGVVFGEQSGTRPDALANPRVRLVLFDGSTLDGGIDEMTPARISLRLDEGIAVTVPTLAVTRIEVQSDKLVHLADLQPKIEQTPAFDRTWPPLWNHGPGGGAIELGGVKYDRGVVLVPRTALEYRIDKRFDVFEAMIGLEEHAGATANAVFRVRGDGDVLFDSGSVTPGSPPAELAVPVTGVTVLTLEVDFGENLDMGDLCVFANPRLLKK